MSKQLETRLDPVRRRQNLTRAMRHSAVGLLISACALLFLAAARWLVGWELSPTSLIAIAISGPVVGCLVAKVSHQDWHAAALAVDTHYQLKDRASTALDFSHKRETTKIHQLAVADAIQHLSTVDPRAVVPLQSPRTLPYALAMMLAAVALFVLTARPESVSAHPPEPLAVVVAQAERLAEHMKPLEDFAKEHHDPEIDKLIEEMKQAIEEMKKPETDLREAMAKLSEIESALQQQQAKYNSDTVDAQLKAVGDILTLADPTAQAGKALASGQLEKAAEELAKLNLPQLDRQTEKSMTEKLDEVARQMQSAGNNSLSQATGKMAQGLAGDGARFSQGAQQLGAEAANQGQKKKLLGILHSQCQCVGECKGECENPSKGEGKGKGGKSWGLGVSGNEPGDPTVNLGGKQEMRLAGEQSNDGEFEVETTHSPEGQEQARRTYRETYDKYRKLSDAVLEGEEIPLGQRQTIRRYFESIRPQETNKGDKDSNP